MGPGFESLRVYKNGLHFALLAQLVEQLTLNQWVQGSNPWRCIRGIYEIQIVCELCRWLRSWVSEVW